MLRKAGLRPTRQRISLACLMYGAGNRHLSAESLHAEAVAAGIQVSLATVYNTLNQFTAVGLLREVAIEGHKTYFDTNTSNHYHYYIEQEGRLSDIPSDDVRVGGPAGGAGRHAYQAGGRHRQIVAAAGGIELVVIRSTQQLRSRLPQLPICSPG